MSETTPDPETDSEDPVFSFKVTRPGVSTQALGEHWQGSNSVQSSFDRAMSQDGRDALRLQTLESRGLYKGLFSDSDREPSKVRFDRATQYQPFDMCAATRMRELSPHHGTCLDLVTNLVMGHGFSDDKVKEVLDGMSPQGIYHELRLLVTNLVELGNGYLEVVREGADQTRPISSIFNVPAQKVLAVQDGERRHERHYMYVPYISNYYYGNSLSEGGAPSGYDSLSGAQTSFACFGDLRRVQLLLPDSGRRGSPSDPVMGATEMSRISEVVHLINPTTMWEYYGAPSWLGAIPSLEMARMHILRSQLYMTNRSTPDTLTVVAGAGMTKKQQEDLQSCLKVDSYTQHGTSAVLAFQNPEVKVTKLEYGDALVGEDFATIHDATALAICSAHGVPPVLAGINTTKTLGSNSEISQALVILQISLIAPIQKMVSDALARTLGHKEYGIEGLKGNKFELKPITEIDDLQALNVAARQKQADSPITRGTEKPTAELKR